MSTSNFYSLLESQMFFKSYITFFFCLFKITSMDIYSFIPFLHRANVVLSQATQLSKLIKGLNFNSLKSHLYVKCIFLYFSLLVSLWKYGWLVLSVLEINSPIIHTLQSSSTSFSFKSDYSNKRVGHYLTKYLFFSIYSHSLTFDFLLSMSSTAWTS